MFEIAAIIATLVSPLIFVWAAAKTYNDQKRKDTVGIFLATSSTNGPELAKAVNAVRTQFIGNKEIQDALDIVMNKVPPGFEGMVYTTIKKDQSLETVRRICAIEAGFCTAEEAENFDFTKEFQGKM